ncbi:hypothetical protein [Sporichthya sp.]|uniref:hypothetical protein n=1 Tax=Sporichthya sp. TaxID=65475 RepID=UPI00180C0F11|nr:hypothetical protein [Sporichthya sp.]MBA3745541.1 hypothetical protein [Sporichthya sp.]
MPAWNPAPWTPAPWNLVDDALAALDAAHVQGDVAAVLGALALLVDNLPANALAAPSGCGTF